MTSSLRQRTWNWLPAFIEVADRGSVAAAAKALHVTPAAISRTLRLLENEVGHELFNRVGRGLVLNVKGATLRDAVRRAAIAIDDGFNQAFEAPFAGPLRVASLGVVTDALVIPELIALKVQYPSLIPEHLNVGSAQAVEMVARGEIDVAFYYEELGREGTVVERLGATTASVYCGRGHPLFAARTPSKKDLAAHSFSVPQIGDSGRPLDGWPADSSRDIGMRITMLRSNLEVCLSGTLLTVLPDVTALPHLRSDRLRRLAAQTMPPIEVYAATSARADAGGRATTLVAQVRNRLVAVNNEIKKLLSKKRRS